MSPKNRRKILTKATDKGKNKIFRIPTIKTREYILIHAESEMIIEYY